MPVDNLVGMSDVAGVQSLDFATQFGFKIGKLLEAMGVTRQLPLASGMVVKTYKSVNDVHSGTVGEGELIPLSEVTKVLDQAHVMDLKKWRKAVSAEAIQQSGLDVAVTNSDSELLKEIQKGIRSEFFTYLGTGAGAEYGVGIQKVLAKAWGQVQTLFDDDAASTVAFVNPLDVADYIGSANITTQTEFGMSFVSGFSNVLVVQSTAVPVGKVFATAVENLIYAYIPMGSSEITGAFGLTVDETGYIGVNHGVVGSAATIETIAYSGSKLFAERTDGLVELDIVTEAVDTQIKAAIVLVEGAEASELTADKTAAQTAVTALPAVNIKAVLQARVTAIVVS